MDEINILLEDTLPTPTIEAVDTQDQAPIKDGDEVHDHVPAEDDPPTSTIEAVDTQDQAPIKDSDELHDHVRMPLQDTTYQQLWLDTREEIKARAAKTDMSRAPQKRKPEKKRAVPASAASKMKSPAVPEPAPANANFVKPVSAEALINEGSRFRSTVVAQGLGIRPRLAVDLTQYKFRQVHQHRGASGTTKISDGKINPARYGATVDQDLGLCFAVFGTFKDCVHGNNCELRHEWLTAYERRWMKWLMKNNKTSQKALWHDLFDKNMLWRFWCSSQHKTGYGVVLQLADKDAPEDACLQEGDI